MMSAALPDMADRAKRTFLIQNQVVPGLIFQIVAGYACNHPVHDPDPLCCHFSNGSIGGLLALGRIFFHERMRCAEIALYGAEGYMPCQQPIVAGDAALRGPFCFDGIAVVLGLISDCRRCGNKNGQQYEERTRREHLRDRCMETLLP